MTDPLQAAIAAAAQQRQRAERAEEELAKAKKQLTELEEIRVYLVDHITTLEESHQTTEEILASVEVALPARKGVEP